MANRNYSLEGVGSTVHYGKGGGKLSWDAANNFFQVTHNDGTTLADVRIATGVPAAANSVATKQWVQDEITANVQGLNIKNAVACASTGPLDGTYFHNTALNDSANPPVPNGGKGDTFTMTATGPLVIDSYTTVLGDRVLLKDQVSGEANGIYVVTTAGATGVAAVLTRAEDANNHPQQEVTPGMFVFSTKGTINGNNGWVVVGNDANNDGIFDLGSPSEPIQFGQFSGAAQIHLSATSGLSKSGNDMYLNTDGTTMYVDATNKIAVKSSGTAGQTLVSAGSGTATWGALDLANTAATTGVLPTSRGGAGIDLSTNTGGELLVGVSGGLAKLPKPVAGQNYVLQWNDAGNAATWVAQSAVGDYSFKTYSVAGQSDIVATQVADQFTFGVGTGALAGIKLTTSGKTLTIGHDIVSMTASSANLAGTDKVVVYNGTANVAMTGQQVADGLVSLLALDNTEIFSVDGLTKVDTDAVAGHVTFNVKNGAASHRLLDMGFGSGTATATFANSNASGTNEMALTAGDAGGMGGSSTANVDIRLVPGKDGKVIVGTGSDAIVTAVKDKSLRLDAGAADATAAGAVFVTAGAGKTGVDSGNGGNVVVTGGAADGGVAGKAYYSKTYTGTGAYTPVVLEEIATLASIDKGPNLANLSTAAVVGADTVLFFDASAADAQEKRTFTQVINDLDIVTTASITGGLLTKTADDTYVGRTLTSGTGTGLKVVDGDGVAGNPTISLDIAGANALPAGTIAASDLIAFADVSDSNNMKTSTVSSLLGSALGNYFQQVTGDAGAGSSADTQTDTIALVGLSNGGIKTFAEEVGGVDTVSFKLKIDTLDARASAIAPAADVLAYHDSVADQTKKITFTQMVTDLTLVQAARAITTSVTSGLSGGGDLSADRALRLNIGALTAATTIADTNLIAIEDGTSDNKKVTWANAKTQLVTDLNLDGSQIVNSATTPTAAVSTSAAGVNGVADNVVVSSANVAGTAAVKVVEIAAASTTDNAAGAYFKLTQGEGVHSEVRIEGHNTAGTGDVDIRLVPQNAGQVYIGDVGAGVIQADSDYTLTVKGGNYLGAIASPLMDVIVAGGNGSGTSANGNAFVRAGHGGSGTAGIVAIQDGTGAADGTGNIAVFSKQTGTPDSWLVMQSAAAATQPLKITAGGATNVNIELAPTGTGKLYYGDSSVSTNEVATLYTVQQSTDALCRTATVTANGTLQSFDVGAALNNIAGKTYLVDRIIIEVTTAFNADAGAEVKDDGGKVYALNSSFDLTSTGTYFIDVPMTQSTAGNSIFQLKGFTAAPTTGVAKVTVQYRVI